MDAAGIAGGKKYAFSVTLKKLQKPCKTRFTI